MWTAEYIDDLAMAPSSEDQKVLSGNTIVTRHLRGPICIVGRKMDCDIVFLKDKTISRQHAEIHIPQESSDSSLYIVDLNSKFHTYIRDTELIPNEKTAIQSGDVVRFGVSNTSVKFVKKSCVFTTTRLEPNDKERLKELSKGVGAKCVDSGNDWTHLFANKFTATVKILTAIVFKRPLVTVDWLASFADSAKYPGASAIIPPTRDFFPTRDETIALKDPDISRAESLKDFVVIFLHKSHEQYYPIIRGCGGECIRLYQQPVTAMKDALLSILRQENMSSKRITRLDDETVKVEKGVLAVCCPLIAFKLSVGEVAKAVMQLETPRELSAVTQTQLAPSLFIEQTFRARESPTPVGNPIRSQDIEAPKAVELIPIASMKVPAPDITTPTPGRTVVATPMEEITVKADKVNDRTAAKSVVDTNKRTFDEAMITTSTTSVENDFPVPSMAVDAEEDTLFSPAKKKKVSAKSIKTSGASGSNKSSSSKSLRDDKPHLSTDKVNQPMELSIGKSSNKRPDLNSSSGVMSAEVKIKSSPTSFGQMKANEGGRKIQQSEDGWFEASSQTKTANFKSQISYGSSEEREHVEYPLAETIEIVIPMRAVALRGHRSSDTTCASSSHARDVRRFKKNFIRSVDQEHRLSKHDMNLLLPKESEREIQLRLDDEMEIVQEREKDELFADRFGITKSKRR